MSGCVLVKRSKNTPDSHPQKPFLEGYPIGKAQRVDRHRTGPPVWSSAALPGLFWDPHWLASTPDAHVLNRRYQQWLTPPESTGAILIQLIVADLFAFGKFRSFSASLGLINPASLKLNLLLGPGIHGGVVVGRLLLGKIHQQDFEWLMILFSLAGGLRLVLTG
jgi:hypothetical protein